MQQLLQHEWEEDPCSDLCATTAGVKGAEKGRNTFSSVGTVRNFG